MAKKILKIFLIVVLVIILLGLVGVYFMFREEIGIMGSIQTIDEDKPIYTMEYNTDYHMNEILERGAASDKELSEILTEYISHGFYSTDGVSAAEPGCSSLTAISPEGNMVWGRNFDWYYSVPIIVKSTPKEGYASIATCEFTNITGDSSVRLDSMPNKFLAVAAYYVPMDGVNEKGLCVSDQEVNEGGMEFVDTDKTNLTITMAIRMLLNKAATVDEALELLDQYDIAPSGSVSHHLIISDATGKSVAVEFVDGKQIAVESPYITNFNMANGDMEAGGESARDRYLTLKEEYEKTDGVMDLSQLTKAMEKVSQKEGKWQTRWTLCYQFTEGQPVAFYYFNGNYDKPVTVTMDATVITE